MKPLELTGDDIQLIVSALNQTIDQWLVWVETKNIPNGFDSSEAMEIVRELAALVYRIEDYLFEIEEELEIEESLPDNVIKFKREEK
jgi:hypothetical protein